MSINTYDHQDQLTSHAVSLITTALKTSTPSDRQKLEMFKRITSNNNLTLPEGAETLRQQEGEWFELMPLVEIKVLHIDKKHNTQTALWRLHPGAEIPSHPHAQDEECLMLEGEVEIAEHKLYAGDFHLIKSGFDHPPISSKTGALVHVRGELMEHLAF